MTENKNPLNLEIGKSYWLQYIHCKSRPELHEITRFTPHDHPWGVKKGGHGHAITENSYIIVKDPNAKPEIKELSKQDKSVLIEICRMTSNNRNVDILEEWLTKKGIV